MKKTDLELFTAAFIDAIYFTDTGDVDQPDANIELDTDARLDIEADCRSWWRRFGCYVTTEATVDHVGGKRAAIKRAGYDFWFTRNGHGVGFWEPGRWPGCYVETFDRGAKSYGPMVSFDTDDGLLAVG